MKVFPIKIFRQTWSQYLTALPILLIGIFATPQLSHACMSWINPAGGNWSDANSWQSQLVPPPMADICINLPGTYTVNVDIPVQVNSLTLGRSSDGVQTLMATNSLTLNGSSVIDSTGVLLMSISPVNAGAELTNFGEIIIAGSSSSLANLSGQIINRASISINSKVRMTGGGHLILNEEDGTLNFAGGSEIYHQNGASSIINRGNLIKTDDSDTTSIRVVFNNEGGTVHAGAGRLIFTQVNLSDGTYYAGPDGTIAFDFTSSFNYMSGRLSGNPDGKVVFESGNIRADEAEAILDFGGDGFTWNGGTLMAQGSGTWINEGLIRTSGSSNKLLSGVSFTNRGSMEVGGQVNLGSVATLINEAGAVLGITDNATIGTSTGGGSFINRGLFYKESSENNAIITPVYINEGGDVDVRTGTLRFRNVRLIGGTYNADAGAVLALDFSSPSYARGRLSGNPEGTILFQNGTFRADEEEAILDFGAEGLHWDGGSLLAQGTGTWINEGLIQTSGSSNKTLSGVAFTNRGSMEVGGQVNLGSAATLINEAGAMLGITDSTTIGTSTGGGSFINRGLFYKEFSENNAIITPVFINEGGDVDVRTGTLRFRNVRLIGGTYNADAGAVLALDFSSQSYAQGRLSGNPEGTIVFQSGNLNAFEGTAILDFGNEGFHFTGGTFRGDPTSGLDSGDWLNEGLLSIYGGSSKGMNVSTFINRGTMLFDANVNFLGGSSAGRTITNMAEGAIRLGDGIVISNSQGASWMINHGLIFKPGESGTSTISLVFDNKAGGIVAGAGTIAFNNLRKNNGIVTPGSPSEDSRGTAPGRLVWSGALPMDSTTAGIDIGIGGTQPETGYDRLDVTGTMTLQGTLSVDLTGGFTPQDGDVFVPITANSITGGFEVLQGLTTSTMSLYPIISDTSIILTAQPGVHTISGALEVIPSSLSNGNITTFNISGTGFAPDATFRLECTSCDFPELSFPVNGRIRSMTPTNAMVQFDLRNAFISGGYNLMVEDPRGGSASAPITIGGSPGLTGLSVYASKPDASERGPEPGIITLVLNAPSSQRLTVNYELGGTAEPYVHFVPSIPYSPTNPSNFFSIPAGATEIDVIITPLPNFDTHDGKTVVFTLLGSDQFEIAGQTQATVSIENGPPPTEMDIFTASPNQAGNVGTIMMLIAGQGLTDDATAQLAGSTTIASDFIFAEPGGTMLNAMFDLSGTTPGDRFDLVVNDGSGKTFILQNALLIEELVEPEISVQLSGPNFFRSWLPPIRYYVTVSNRGNVDAMMVPLSIAVSKAGGGILEPEFDVFDLDPTQFDFMPDGFPGWGDNIALEDRGDRNVLSVIIPFIKAGETMVFSYLGRGRRHKAWTSPSGDPVVDDTGPVFSRVSAVRPNKVTLSTADNTVNMWMGISIEETIQMALIGGHKDDAGMMTPDEIAALTAGEAQAIANCVGAMVLNVGLGVLPTSCAQAIAARVTGFISAVVSVTSSPSDRTATVSGLSMVSALVTTTLQCATDLNPWARGIGFGMGLVAGVNECIDIFGEMSGDGLGSDEIGAYDPNDKLGPAGNTSERYTAGIDAAGYLIRFENDTSATAPALLVHITDQIDTEKFDLTTFSLGPVGFGDILVTPPPGLKQWTTLIEVPDEDRFVVRVNASLNMDSGVATWQMMAIDPETGQYPMDPTAGFLPPNHNPPEGDGSVFFTIKPKENLPSGTQLCNEASIVFDVEDPIITPPWCNVLDFDDPVSQMLALEPEQGDTIFTVSWDGFDPTSGVAEFLVYYSTNEGPYSLWKLTEETSAVFTGAQDSTYSFYSVARDIAGNFEQKRDVAEVSTTINMVTSSDEAETGIPYRFALHQNYPNPFNPSTTIRYDVPEAAHVTIVIYNVLGQKVADIVDREHQPGYHTVVWDGKNMFGNPVASGTYLYRIQAGDFTQVRKLMMIK